MSRVRLLNSASKACSLLVILAVVSVVGLVQGAGGPLTPAQVVAPHSVALAYPAPTPPPPTDYSQFLPEVTHTVETPPRFLTLPSPNLGSAVAISWSWTC